MSEFQDQLHEAFGARAQIKSEGGPHWSRAALEEFAEWIEKESGGRVWARTRDMGGIEGYTRLEWGPLTRPVDAQTLLVVDGRGERAVKLGPEQHFFVSKEELQADILSFVQLDEFRASLEELVRLAGEPVEGFLRSGYPRDRDPANDVFVEVPADEQRRIAEVYLDPSKPPAVDGVRVRLLGPSPIGKGVFQERKGAVEWLVSGGVAVKLVSPLREDGDWVVLSGEVQRDA